MPVIRPSSDLRNNYNEISTICHQTKSPVYITKNGAGDLAVMSIELYEMLTDRLMLYKELQKGIDSLDRGEIISEEELYEELDKI
jgi:prevent-host-death family protein